MPYRERKPTQCGACNRWIVALSNHQKSKIHMAAMATIKARNTIAGFNFPRGKLYAQLIVITSTSKHDEQQQ